MSQGSKMDFNRLYEAQICPVCGFQLDFTPWADDSAIERPCPCCGIHFGEHDVIEAQRWQAYAIRRHHWIDYGMRWWSGTEHAKSDYNPEAQLARLTQLLEDFPD